MLTRDVETVADLEDALSWLRSSEAVRGQICELSLRGGTYELSASLHELLVFGSASPPSEIILRGDGDVIFRPAPPHTRRRAQQLVATAPPALISIGQGAPPITMRGLIVEGGDDLPAVEIHSERDVRIEECTFRHNAGSGIVVVSARVAIQSCRFHDNGQAEGTLGGAMRVQDGLVTIDDATFSRNGAAVGGALHVGGSARVSVLNATFANNTASDRGGALFIGAGAQVLFGSHSLLMSNQAAEGNSLFLHEGASAAYRLPAPRGLWMSNIEVCEASATAMTSPFLCPLNATVSVVVSGSQDSDFPFPCAAGYEGESLLVKHQNSPQCSGLCRAGHFCPTGTVTPLPCPKGSFCFAGSSRPLQCPPGTFGPGRFIKSDTDCTICPPGHYCRNGANTPCGEGRYNNATGAESRDQCLRCPRHSSTLEENATSREACQCASGYFDDRYMEDGALVVHSANGSSIAADSVHCMRCMQGTDCDGAFGITRDTLPIRPGFWRYSSISLDIRSCPDATVNCTDGSGEPAACATTTSGCAGGRDHSKICGFGLSGAFCQLCNDNATWQSTFTDRMANASVQYYVGATPAAEAHCEPCGPLTVGPMMGFAGAALVVFLLLAGLVYALSKCARVRDACKVANGFLKATKAANKVKICIGFYMLVCKLESVYGVTLPNLVSDVMNVFDSFTTLGLDVLQGLPTTQCIGMDHYEPRLIMYMALFPIGLTLLFPIRLAMLKYTNELSCDKCKEQFVAMFVKLLFLFYPIITTLAFKAFACYSFEQNGVVVGRYLIDDVSIDCDSSEYDRIFYIAIIAVVVYPVGAIVISWLLLGFARQAILEPLNEKKPRRWLARGLFFLYSEFTPDFFFWECMEMLRRFLLVGFAVVVQPGSIVQILAGTIVAVFFLFIQLITQPFRDKNDGFLAATCSFMIVLSFTCCIVFQYNAYMELNADDLLPVHRGRFLIPADSLGLLLLLCIMTALVLSFTVLAYEVHAEHQRALREARTSSNRRLRHRANAKEVPSPLGPDYDYHVFLSHVWSTGQDQMRVVKQRLLEMLPELKVFLDVDDLKEIGDLEGYISRSKTTLVFCSNGYFSSCNCMRELLSSVHFEKPIIALLEPDASKGGLQREEIAAQLERAEHNYAERWGLADQIREWGWEMPIDKRLLDGLFSGEAIEWNRIGDFQDVTLRLIAERVLSLPGGSTYMSSALQTAPGSLMLRAPGEGKHHLYFSKHNKGAAPLIQEVALKQRLIVKVTSNPDELHTCAQMLVYLDATTWQSGAISEALAAEITRAMDADVPLLLAHEMPGEHQEGRGAIEFGKFFVCEEGATPDWLLKRGIYKTIAVALKGGEWRKASMVRLAEGIGAVTATKDSERTLVQQASIRALDLSASSSGRRSSLDTLVQGLDDAHRKATRRVTVAKRGTKKNYEAQEGAALEAIIVKSLEEAVEQDRRWGEPDTSHGLASPGGGVHGLAADLPPTERPPAEAEGSPPPASAAPPAPLQAYAVEVSIDRPASATPPAGAADDEDDGGEAELGLLSTTKSLGIGIGIGVTAPPQSKDASRERLERARSASESEHEAAKPGPDDEVRVALSELQRKRVDALGSAGRREEPGSSAPLEKSVLLRGGPPYGLALANGAGGVVVVRQILPGSPAAVAGVPLHCAVLEINGASVVGKGAAAAKMVFAEASGDVVMKVLTSQRLQRVFSGDEVVPDE